jgi:hypothetical protein
VQLCKSICVSKFSLVTKFLKGSEFVNNMLIFLNNLCMILKSDKSSNYLTLDFCWVIIVVEMSERK